MASVVISGDTSGAITLSAPSVAGTNTLTLPALTGTVMTNKTAGTVLQVVSTSSTTSTSTTGTAYVQWGATLSISPTSSTSKILVVHNATWYSTSTANAIYATVYRNATNLDLGNGRGFYEANIGSSGVGMPVPINYLDSPTTTSSTTYSIYFRNSVNNGTLYYNTDGSGGTITLMEIAA